MRRVRTGVALLVTVLLWSGVAWALTPNAQVYELTENASLIARGAVGSESSVSSMLGFIQSGSALCPAQFAAPARRAHRGRYRGDIRDSGPVCTVTITGNNIVDLATGLGTINGTFAVLGPDPINPLAVDAPEVPVITGTFYGNMDFSPAVLAGAPYGTVTGVLTAGTGVSVAFKGVFMMPFDAACSWSGSDDRDDRATSYVTDCYLTYALSGTPSVVTVTGMVPVTPAQKAIDYPTARFDIYFQQ
jgi:hypothetical protein